MFLGRVVAPGEPSWLPLDSAKALAYQQHLAEEQAATCPHCGTKDEHWFDENGFRHKTAAWQTERVRKCRGCEVLEEAESAMSAHDKERFRVALRPTRLADVPIVVPRD